jgi:hypothetical protein
MAEVQPDLARICFLRPSSDFVSECRVLAGLPDFHNEIYHQYYLFKWMARYTQEEILVRKDDTVTILPMEASFHDRPTVFDPPRTLI